MTATPDTFVTPEREREIYQQIDALLQTVSTHVAYLHILADAPFNDRQQAHQMFLYHVIDQLRTLFADQAARVSLPTAAPRES